MSFLVNAAANFAMEEHYRQMYGGMPYFCHLESVVSVLKRYGYTYDDEIIAAGYLHDIVEDCSISVKEISEKFGSRVSELVDAVTDGEGKNRKERKLRSHKLISETKDAIIIKLADMIANVENCIRYENIGLGKMYKKEYPHFADVLRRDGEAKEMWERLDYLLK